MGERAISDAEGQQAAATMAAAGVEPTVAGDEEKKAPSPAVESKTTYLPQYCAGIVASCISIANGFSYTWPAVAQPLLQDPSASPMAALPGGALTDDQASWLASLLYICALAALAPACWAGRHFGRKAMGWGSGALLLLQWLVLAASCRPEALYAARALAGACGGALFFFTAIYIREVSEDAVRGTVGTFMPLLFNVGVLLVYSVGGLLSYEALNLMGLCLTCFFMVAFWWMPESPHFLAARGRSAEAERALRWLRGPRADVQAELRELEGTLKRRAAEDAGSLRQLCADRASVKGLLLTTVLCANQPLCGFFVVLSYAVNIFKEASPEISSHLASSIIGVLFVFGTLLATRLVERLGRKVLFLTSDGVMAVCLAALGTYSYYKSIGTDVSSFNWVPVASLSIFMAAVSLAIVTLPYVIMTEIFLPQAQQVAIILGGFVILALGFLATKFFPTIVDSLGLHTCYWFFAALSFIIMVFIYFELPETKGRTLESIREELAGKKPDLQMEKSIDNKSCKESV